jgi:type IV secretion system protein VirB3
MLETKPMRRSGHRDTLLLGADRELLLFSGLISFTLIYAGVTATSGRLFITAFGVVQWFIILHLLRMMGKSDPKMRHVYRRHRRYKAYYPARSTPFRVAQPQLQLLPGRTRTVQSPW